MTTDAQLRDLLTGEAAGPIGGSDGWDDVVRRGRKRRLARRVQTVGAIALVAGLAATIIAVAADDPTVDTVPPVTDPTSTDLGERLPAASVELPSLFRLPGIRAQGGSVTILMLWESGQFDACTQLRPRVAESSGPVTIDLVGAADEHGGTWADCRSGDREAWATVELADPVGADAVVRLGRQASREIDIDGTSLLFPSELPAPFALERRTESSGRGSELDEDGYRVQARSWGFSWAAGRSGLHLAIHGLVGEDVRLDLSRWLEAECDGETKDVALRGTTAHLCSADPDGGVSHRLAWEEDGKAIVLDYTSTDEAPLALDDVLAVAAGLEPLGG